MNVTCSATQQCGANHRAYGNPVKPRILIYGANGYTGALISRLAAERGMLPVLAGRDAGKIKELSSALGTEHRVFGLDDESRIEAALGDTRVVLHCAGPFSRTAAPMVRACLRTRTHYLDITGEVAVFEAIADRDVEAKASGVMLMPGVGFDVVPSDCLAAHLKRRLPSAKMLALAIQSSGRVSRGTAATMIENIHKGGLVRRNGRLTAVPAASKTRTVDFGRGPVKATVFAWGDLATAFRSTGIENIEVFAVVPGAVRWTMIASRWMGSVLGSAPVQRFLMRLARKHVSGPSEADRRRGFSLVWGEVEDTSGAKMRSRLRCPEAYQLTALTSLAVARRVLAGEARPGFQTPSLVFGPDLILEIEGVIREDID